jgi:hypothetical protein
MKDAAFPIGLWAICAWCEFNQVEGLAFLVGLFAIAAALRNLP